MKVILNEDVKHLGEEGDIKDVANGYARNYLFPRSYAVPCNPMTLAYFETRKAEIEAKKEAKRANAASLKEKLEAVVVNISMPAGANGKLYGAVTNQTVTEALHNMGFDVERKRVELPGLTFKSVGKYHAVVRLYENASATIQVVVSAPKKTPLKRKKRRLLLKRQLSPPGNPRKHPPIHPPTVKTTDILTGSGISDGFSISKR